MLAALAQYRGWPGGNTGVLLLISVETTHARGTARAQTPRMFEEHRREPRESLALPVKMTGDVHAITRDISPSGMYLEIRGNPGELEGALFFEMHLEEAKMKFTSEGRIVRVEQHDGFTGIAVKLVSPKLEALD
jgi:hypothetical protein